MKKIIKKIIPTSAWLILRRIKFWPLRLRLFFEFLKIKITKPEIGTENWLILKEMEFGGFVKDVPIKSEIAFNAGGDRMSNKSHGYGKIYAEYLKPFIKSKNPITLVEVGILKGTGVAIWSELFTNGRIIGLDIDLSNIKKNMNNLKKRGAFKNENLELYVFDQFIKNEKNIEEFLKGDKINICIDDGEHSNEAILKTMESIAPYLANDFIYFIEDNEKVYNKIIDLYSNLNVKNFGEMTVVYSKNNFIL